jgi:hypothetical protein
MSEEELWALCQKAHHQYHKEVMGGSKCYRRFASDFLAYHFLIGSLNLEVWRTHLQNMVRMGELFFCREELAKFYFGRKDYTAEHHQSMIFLFQTGQPLRTDPEKPSSLCLALFSQPQVDRLTKFINERDLFITKLTSQQVYGFFACTNKAPLQARMNGAVAALLWGLWNEGLLPKNWQAVAARCRIISSSKDQVPLSAQRISTCLNEYRSYHNDLNLYTDLAKELKKLGLKK